MSTGAADYVGKAKLCHVQSAELFSDHAILENAQGQTPVVALVQPHKPYLRRFSEKNSQNWSLIDHIVARENVIKEK